MDEQLVRVTGAQATEPLANSGPLAWANVGLEPVLHKIGKMVLCHSLVVMT